MLTGNPSSFNFFYDLTTSGEKNDLRGGSQQYINVTTMRYKLLLLLVLFGTALHAQVSVDLKGFSKKSGASATAKGDLLTVSWPAGEKKTGRLVVDLSAGQPVVKSLSLQEGGKSHAIATGLDAAFLLTVGKRDLVSQNGWNIFFDKVPNKPFRSYNIELTKLSAAVSSTGAWVL
jgi:hypothetical protein